MQWRAGRPVVRFYDAVAASSYEPMTLLPLPASSPPRPLAPTYFSLPPDSHPVATNKFWHTYGHESAWRSEVDLTVRNPIYRCDGKPCFVCVFFLTMHARSRTMNEYIRKYNPSTCVEAKAAMHAHGRGGSFSLTHSARTTMMSFGSSRAMP